MTFITFAICFNVDCSTTLIYNIKYTKVKWGAIIITYQTKNNYVYDEIKKDILLKRLKGGERLIVNDLAKKYGVSPMPVREALIRLEQEEFLEIIPHIGAKVSSYNEEKLREIHQIRIELESTATRLLVSVITDEQIDILDNIMKDGKLIIDRGNASEFFDWNRRFHHTIAEMNPNRTLEEYIKTDWQKLELIGDRIGFQKWRSDKSYAEHMLWVDALRLRDPVAAEAACRRHCSTVSELNLDTFL